ncbi:MAG: RtcB family protein [Planctomycetota bacterium]
MTAEGTNPKVQKIDDYRWRIPREGKMRTDGIIYTDQKMLMDIQKDLSLTQVANVACLPGIVGHSLAMPDIHWGYGFPIGGVAAFDLEEGVISPGGVGYDINCGVRLMRSNLTRAEIQPDLRKLIEAIYKNIPSGVGSRRKDLRVQAADEIEILTRGAAWAIEQGYLTFRRVTGSFAVRGVTVPWSGAYSVPAGRAGEH